MDNSAGVVTCSVDSARKYVVIAVMADSDTGSEI
jgi:hypothetical protein